MSETVGRVDFIASLDGNKLPQQARQLGNRIGKEAGEGFDKSFNDKMQGAFDRQSSNFAKTIAGKMSESGRLAGERFSTTFERSISSRFRGIQNELGDILTDRGAFDRFAGGFTNVGEAVESARANLERLRHEQVAFTDENGDVEMQMVMTEREFYRANKALSDMANQYQLNANSSKALEDSQRRLALETRDLEAAERRLMSVIGNSDDFRTRAEQLGGTEKAYAALRSEVTGLGRELGRTDNEIGEHIDRLDRTHASILRVDEATRQASLTLKDTDTNVVELDRSILSLGERWKSLGHNTRQWTLIIGAIMAGMQDLSVLSSALGGGLFAVGGALSSLVVGGGGAVAVFSTLAKDVEDLPPELQDVAREFRGVGSELVRVRDVISDSAIREMPGTFDRISDSVSGLAPQFSRLGTSVGIVFDDFSRGVQKGSDGFEELNSLIGNAVEDFPALANAAGTWATGLLRGLNKANPIVDQLIGYVQELGDRFEAFSRSDNFDRWIRNSMETFREFGGLLDATGRALNDLVTPESIVRTQEFLGNLTDFMPNLSQLLDMLGRLDVFGLAAQMLNDFGQALEPLAGPMAELADEINDVASVAIEQLAVALEIVATVATPVAEALGDILDAMPPEVLSVLTGSVLGLAGAMLVLKGARGVGGALTAMGLLSDSMSGMVGRADKLGGKLSSALGKAGMVGIALVGVTALFDGIQNLTREMSGIDSATRELIASNASFADSFDKVAEKMSGVGFNAYIGDSIADIDDMDQALTRLGDNDFSLMLLDDFDAGAAGAGRLKVVLDELDEPLAGLAATDLTAATGQFTAWANELGASDAQVLNMLNRMPEFKEQLQASAEAAGVFATDQDLVNMALGRTPGATRENVTALDLLSESAALTKGEIQSLADEIRGFGDANLTTRDAARDFEASLADLTASVTENGTSLDISTEKGRANESAIDALARSTLDLSAATLEQTGKQGDANDVIARGREELIKQLEQFGLTGKQAEDYADKLGLIPGDVSTKAVLEGVAAAEETLRQLTRNRTAYISVRADGTGYSIGNIDVTPYARGGQVYGPTHALIGEAGPEAVVPLNRPLNQVDESVRWLSAIAQGKAVPMAGGGIAGGGTQITFEPGSIVVQGADDPRETAYEVADLIAERISS